MKMREMGIFCMVVITCLLKIGGKRER
jgi:hypothetical protein